MISYEKSREVRMDLRWVYITVGSKEEARRIGKVLVTSKLVACVNIFDRMNSIYYWDGKLQDDTEAVLIAKTTRERLPRVFEAVKQQHRYEIPCMISLPIMEGYDPFLEWIEKEVEPG